MTTDDEQRFSWDKREQPDTAAMNSADTPAEKPLVGPGSYQIIEVSPDGSSITLDRPEKPREWWIADKSPDDNEYAAVDIHTSELIIIPPEHHGYHVIEKSAYDRVVAENARLRAALEEKC